MKNNGPTIAAIATYPAPGAIGIIRISGPDTLRISEKFFKPLSGKPISSLKPSLMTLGTIDGPDGPVDEVLFTYFKAPRSFTGEDMAEISCHGSVFILSKIMSLLAAGGACQAGPGDFTRRAFLNGKMDLTQAEAVADLVNASSDSALSISLSQLFGREKEAISALRLEIIKIFSVIESGLDFEQEGPDHAPAAVLSSFNAVRSALEKLISGAARGIALKDGVTVAITGRPNAGKSSLFNALVRSDRSIVTHLPGTTRDTIEERAMIDGIKYRFIDTAGIRGAADIAELEGIKRARAAAQASDLVIFVADPTDGFPDADLKAAAEMAARPMVIALNKSDLASAAKTASDAELLRALDAPVVAISAFAVSGINDLTNTVKSIIIRDKGLDDRSEIVVASLRHKAALESALTEMNLAAEALSSGSGLELVSEHVRQAAARTGSIIGAVATDDVLEEIFKNFCIGK
jgi:tRNA modification GTPase